MCGIAGFLGDARSDLPDVASKFNHSLFHRGPDSQGYHTIDLDGHRTILLSHTRLAILDLSISASQPMHDFNRESWIVFNGEIYNHIEIRQELEQMGHFFRTDHSDTEAILHGYEEWGTDILSRIRGMFAFALWDGRKRQLLLAVDGLGIKPLYYADANGSFVFSSEVRAILETGIVNARIDPIGLEMFLSFGAVQGPSTIISGVRSLPPGTYLAVSSDGKVDGPHTWYNLPFKQDGCGTKPVMAEIRHLLDDAVRSHLIADVPVGLFLSGGIDSGVVAGLAAKHSANIKAFSITFPDWPDSEGELARETARIHGLDHIEIPFSESDLLAVLPEALKAMDEPSFDGLNIFVISKAVREAGFKVVLSGMGGDEVFGGYSTFRQLPVLSAWGRRLGPLAPFLREYTDIYGGYALRKGLFTKAVRRDLFPSRPGWSGATERDICHKLDDVNAVSLLELRVYLANMLLRDTDCMSMAHGLEVRVPLLDRPLVDYMANVHGKYKVSRFTHKPLLVGAARDLLPGNIYRRPKQGFVFPWGKWLHGALCPLVEAALLDAETFRSIGMNPSSVAGVWRDFIRGGTGLRWNHVWSLVALREWALRHLPT